MFPIQELFSNELICDKFLRLKSKLYYLDRSSLFSLLRQSSAWDIH